MPDNSPSFSNDSPPLVEAFECRIDLQPGWPDLPLAEGVLA